jgi:hypothetical protein
MSSNQSLSTSSLLLNQNENLSNISYSCEYGSTFDSRAGSLLSIEQSLPIESNRQSISSQTTLIDEEENQFYRPTSLTTDSDAMQGKSKQFYSINSISYSVSSTFALFIIILAAKRSNIR